MKPTTFDQQSGNKKRKAAYFRGALAALMLVLLVSTFGFHRDATDVYKIYGPFVLATVLLLVYGVRTIKGSWIVGSTLLGVVIIGLTLSVGSLIFRASVEDFSAGLFLVAIFLVAPVVALVGALVDTVVRVTRK